MKTYRHVCTICGKDFTSENPRSGYCSEVCKEEGRVRNMERQRMARRLKAILANSDPNKSLAPKSKKVCVICGGEVKSNYASAKYCCLMCRIEGDKRRNEKYNLAKRQQYAKAKKKVKKKKTINDFVLEAKALGLTYGYYTAKVDGFL